MKDFVDELINEILTEEMPKIDNIMNYMAHKIQNDFVGITYNLLDSYYSNYDPKRYIRTDIYKIKHGIDKYGRKHNRSGKMTAKKSKAEKSRMHDRSLYSAIKDMGINGESAIGVARGDYVNGYIAGVVFDESYFDGAMKHSVRGIDEWDIVNNFLFSSDTSQKGNHPLMARTPEADQVLTEYLNNYSEQVDKHYKDACKQFR